MRSLKLKNLRLHIILWVVFIIYDRAYSIAFRGTFDNPWNYVTYFTANIGLFYLNAHFVFPICASTTGIKRFFLTCLMIIAEIVVYIICRFSFLFLLNTFHIKPFPSFTSNVSYLSNCIIRAVYFISLSTCYWFALSVYYSTKKIDELEEARLNDKIQTQVLEKALLSAENARLKAQINPHFLLNTLNFLYNSVSKYSEQVADSFLTLADIMRYALTNAGPDGKVWLEDELDNISNFIRLNQARFNQRLQVSFEIDGDPSGLRVPPLILMTLTENVFKYGDLFNKAEPATIATRIDGNLIIFATQNSRKKNILEQSHGIGLQNIKSRLADFDYSLKIEENDQRYIAILEIKL